MTALNEGLAKAYQSFRGWLFDPIPAYNLVVCRIGLGLVLFLSYLSRWPVFDAIYGPNGYAGHAFFERYPESGQIGWPVPQLFDQLQHVSSGALIYFLYVALLVSAVCFAAGIRPKLFGICLVILHSLFDVRNPASSWGWAVMIKPFVLYVVLASRSQHWSVGTWIRSKRNVFHPAVEWTCSAWPMRLLEVHVTCVFLVLWSRIDEQSWLSGQMLFEALISRDWGRIDFDWYPYLEYLTFPARAALLLELGAVFGLWIGPLRKYWALGLMGLFATLAATTSVGWWDFMMMVVLTAFLPAQWIAWAFVRKPA